MAISFGLTEYAKTLLDRPGIAVNKKNHYGESLITRAAGGGYEDIMDACLNGHAEAVAAFLPHLKTPNTVTSALGWAVENNRV